MSSTGNGDGSAAAGQFTEMTVEDWDQSWEEGRIGFHRDYLHPQLQKHLDHFLGGQKNIRIFFPLCGKSLDMKYFADLGHQVVGVEGSEKALKEFFSEQGVEYTTEPATGMSATLHKSKDNNLRLYKGDFFDFNPSVDGKFDAIWDRGALVAINRCDQERYAALMTSLMAPGCAYLLSVLIYDETKYKGPPHYVPHERVHQLYGPKCKIETLGEEDVFEPKHSSWGISSLVERVYKITPK